MKIRKMRWGYDGGGMACGPVEGDTIVEIIVTHEEHNYFVCAERMGDNMKIVVSPVPVYDLLMEANHYDVDCFSEYEKFENLITEEYDFAIGDMDAEIEKMKKSAFTDVFKLICLAMKEAYQPEDPKQDEAEKFIKEYTEKELEEYLLPEFTEIFDGNDD